MWNVLEMWDEGRNENCSFEAVKYRALCVSPREIYLRGKNQPLIAIFNSLGVLWSICASQATSFLYRWLALIDVVHKFPAISSLISGNAVIKIRNMMPRSIARFVGFSFRQVANLGQPLKQFWFLVYLISDLTFSRSISVMFTKLKHESSLLRRTSFVG